MVVDWIAIAVEKEEEERKKGEGKGRVEGDDSFAGGRSDEETNCSFSPDHSSRGRKLKRFLHGRIQV